MIEIFINYLFGLLIERVWMQLVQYKCNYIYTYYDYFLLIQEIERNYGLLFLKIQQIRPHTENCQKVIT